jgi:predicted extracellular nuclease
MSLNQFKYALVLISVLTSSNIVALELTPIASIQGNQDVSPMLGKQVTVEGIVTANFQDEKSFSGFFIQSQTPRKNSNESNAIFVYDKHNKVTTGDLIRVHGEVSEHNGVTQIAKLKTIDILKSNQKLPNPVAIKLPLNKYNLENLEGMRVTLDEPAFITDHYNYIKYGELVVSSKILMTPTNTVLPGESVKMIQSHNTDDKLIIDDASFKQFPNYTKINTSTPIHIGAKVQVIGVMHYAFDSYRVEISEPIKFLQSPYSKLSKPVNIDADIKIASFNLRNYFVTLDNGKEICGPKHNFECRGADSSIEFDRQQTKLVNAINTAEADIFAIQELENNNNSLKTLVSALNSKNNNKWQYIKTGELGEDVIRVGLIFNKTKITPVGSYKLLNSKVLADFEGDKNREVLLQTFKDSNQNIFNVAVLHLKSKRCSDALNDDKDQNDGQGCYNASRAKVAQQISDWLGSDPTKQKAQASIIIGDFNSYINEDPITVFAKNGYTNLATKFLSDVHWTSIFRGEVGSIDHILANNSALNAAQAMTQWHINSIELGWFDYNIEDIADGKAKPKNYYNSSPFASSDHDIIIAGFTFSSID